MSGRRPQRDRSPPKPPGPLRRNELGGTTIRMYEDGDKRQFKDPKWPIILLPSN
jgi:hypothetical protein